jgi:hypothetical protein
MRTYLIVEQRVADARIWQAALTAANGGRAAAGGGDPMLLHDPSTPGAVIAIVPFESREAALAWRSRPGGAEQMAAAGVELDTVQVRVFEPIINAEE